MPLQKELEATLRSLPIALSPCSPLSTPSLSAKCAVERHAYVPAPSLSSDSIGSSDTNTDCRGTEDEETDSGWESDRSDYPPLPHSNPAAFAAAIGRWEPFNLCPTWDFDPNEARLRSNTRVGPLLFTDGYFDGTSCYNATGNYYTTRFQLPQEHNGDYHPLPFDGGFSENYIDAAIYYAKCLHKNLKAYQHLLYDKDRTVRSDMLTSYPPSVYFGRTAAYELHVYRADTDYHARIEDLHRFHADVYNFLHTLHAILTLEQSAECMKSDMLLLAFDGVTSAPVFVHQGESFQQHAPSANPFLTLEETGFAWSACGLLRFYSELALADITDQVLELTLPDEDLITQLLHQYLLDDPTSFEGSCACGTRHLCEEAKRLHSKQDHFYWHYSDTDTALPPAVPPILFTLPHTFTN